jgi:hypothetical protein
VIALGGLFRIYSHNKTIGPQHERGLSAESLDHRQRSASFSEQRRGCDSGVSAAKITRRSPVRRCQPMGPDAPSDRLRAGGTAPVGNNHHDCARAKHRQSDVERKHYQPGAERKSLLTLSSASRLTAGACVFFLSAMRQNERSGASDSLSRFPYGIILPSRKYSGNRTSPIISSA